MGGEPQVHVLFDRVVDIVRGQIFTPILHWIDGKDGEAPKPEPYPYGSRGPERLDEFINQYGFKRSNTG
jgi:glucose-6-phosphate 1-dehydrogenase